MNKNITRGLALAALTAGFTVLGATAANAIDIGDGDLLDELHVPLDVAAPVTIDGLTVDVLGADDGIGSVGEGITAATGSSNAAALGDLGVDTTELLGDDLTTVVGVPLNVSNTWASVFAPQPSGVAVVPTLSGDPNATAGADDLLDAFVDAPVSVSCSSVTVVSDYDGDCDDGAATPGTGSGSTSTDGDILDLDGLLDGDLLDGDILDGDLLGDDGLAVDQPVTVDDEQIDVLDGDLLDGVLEEDGIDVDFGDSVIDPAVNTNEVGVFDEFVAAIIGAPIDLSSAWVSAFGENGGIVIVPDLTVGTSAITGGAIMSEILAPVAVDCVTVTVLSDYERDCGTTVPEENPKDPETGTPEDPQDDGIVGGVVDEGDDGGDVSDALDPCAVVPTTATTGLGADDASVVNAGALAMAALVGGLTAMGLLALGRKFGATK